MYNGQNILLLYGLEVNHCMEDKLIIIPNGNILLFLEQGNNLGYLIDGKLHVSSVIVHTHYERY